jgi:outer membrane protein OmpA-like peptidoglycan-associated protein/tetratricopeptide (TPR) repeat protein
VIKKVLVIGIFILSISYNLFAQFKSPERYYDNLSYQNAIEGYKKTVEEDNTDGEAMFNLANAYRLNSKTVEAEIWFEQAIIYYPAPICKLYYAQTLLSNSKYSKAKTWFLKYAEDAPSANDSEIAADMADFCQELEDNGMPDYIYSVNEVTFNTLKQDYSPCFYGDSSIVFVSNRDFENANAKKDKWTGDNYMQLFVTHPDANEDYIEPQKFFININSKFHEGPACFSSDNNTIYFTQNQYYKRKVIVDENQNTLLAIYSANFVDGEWINVQKLSFCNEQYTVCHPTLSNEDEFIIFSSDMPGGYGGMDLYIVNNEAGTWGVPENLGEKINTVGNEVFPYLDSDNNLYFSSNMLVGFGGLDIYKAYKNEIGWSSPDNIGVPINSSKDDFGLVINESWSTGYFSSNRKGEDNIYTFTENFDIIIKRGEQDTTNNNKTITENPDKGLSVCGTVINKIYKNLLKDAKVEVVSKCTGDETEIITLADGAFDFPIDENCNYRIKVTKKNFKDTLFNFSTFNPTYNDCIEILVPLTFYDEEVTEISTDIIVFEGQILELYNVYYDFDKYNIRTDASTDLDVLYDILIKYPSMKGELSSHTDCRGTHKYNEVLSDNRAKSAMKYLIGKGIDPGRLTYKGYGETVLKNECADGVDCNEIQHQRNRRTEFKITYLDETIISKEYEKYQE